MIEPLFDLVLVEMDSAASRRMMLAIGDGVRREVTGSAFDQLTSPWAADMQSALLVPVRTFAQGFTAMAEVEAHPIAWEILERWLIGQVHKAPHGESQARHDTLRRFTSLARRIGRELDRLARHPAYSGKSVKGIDPVVLPFYRYGAGRMAPTVGRISDRPVDGTTEPLRQGLLLPYRKRDTAGVVTVWEPKLI